MPVERLPILSSVRESRATCHWLWMPAIVLVLVFLDLVLVGGLALPALVVSSSGFLCRLCTSLLLLQSFLPLLFLDSLLLPGFPLLLLLNTLLLQGLLPLLLLDVLLLPGFLLLLLLDVPLLLGIALLLLLDIPLLLGIAPLLLLDIPLLFGIALLLLLDIPLLFGIALLLLLDIPLLLGIALLLLLPVTRFRTPATLFKNLPAHRFAWLVAITAGLDRALLLHLAGITVAGVIPLIGRQRCGPGHGATVPVIPSAALAFPVAAPVFTPTWSVVGTPAAKVSGRAAIVAHRNAQYEQGYVGR